MKAEVRTSAANEVYALLTAALTEAVPARISKSDVLLLKTNTVDEDGNPVFASVKVTVHSNTATETVPAFDPAKATADYAEHEQQKAEKANAPKKAKANEEQTAVKKLARMNATKEWVSKVMPTQNKWTATEVWESMRAYDEKNKELFSIVPMTAQFLKELAKDVNGPMVNFMTIDGKTYYTMH